LSKNKQTASFFENNFVHLHVPAGATPKDGPSAGITMALALYSLATGKPVPDNIAMTGELTITGKVLPIGGVKEKVIAARRVNIPKLILPIDNKKDFQELPDYIKEGMEIHYVDYFNDVLKVVY
jgi:ATP-dependent Lon protease